MSNVAVCLPFLPQHLWSHWQRLTENSQKQLVFISQRPNVLRASSCALSNHPNRYWKLNNSPAVRLQLQSDACAEHLSRDSVGTCALWLCEWRGWSFPVCVHSILTESSGRVIWSSRLHMITLLVLKEKVNERWWKLCIILYNIACQHYLGRYSQHNEVYSELKYLSIPFPSIQMRLTHVTLVLGNVETCWKTHRVNVNFGKIAILGIPVESIAQVSSENQHKHIQAPLYLVRQRRIASFFKSLHIASKIEVQQYTAIKSNSFTA